jgi:orotate phosphoribosyltransferase
MYISGKVSDKSFKEKEELRMEMIKVHSKLDPKVVMKIIQGHFATSHSHINYYIDLTTLKARQNEAEAAAALMARDYEATTVIDTIVCMEGCEIIGAYLAQELTKGGVLSVNQHQTIYIMTPEINVNGQLIFRDNMQPMIRGKHVLLLLANVTTGQTLNQSLECLQYYGANVVGISAIFSAITSARMLKVNSVFNEKDIPDYKTFDPRNCPVCQQGKKIDAIVNGYGYSEI